MADEDPTATAEDEATDPTEGPLAGQTADEAPADGTTGDETPAEAATATSDKKAAADAVVAERKAKAPQVTRRTVTSRRVTPKGGPAAAAKADRPAKDAPPAKESKARDAKKTEAARRAPVATPARAAVYEKGPSPWWVPALMFLLLIAGALLIMTNYMGVFGDASNVRLVIGLALILGGIVTATQYR
jgi:hypothetical protein